MLKKNENFSNDQDTDFELDLFDFFEYTLRKYKIIVAAAMVGLVLAAFYALVMTTPVYEATAQMYVVNPQDSMLNLSDLQIGSYLTIDYQLVFGTWEVNQMVIENLDLSYSIDQIKSMVRINQPASSRVLQITVTSSNQDEVAPIANEYVKVASQYISDTMLTEKPSVMSVALRPVRPVGPNKKRIVAIGTIIGMMFAVCLLFIIYICDDKVKTSADVARYTGTMPLAVIPKLKSSQLRGRKGVE